MKNDLPEFMDTSEFLSRLFNLGPMPMGHDPVSLVDFLRQTAFTELYKYSEKDGVSNNYDEDIKARLDRKVEYYDLMTKLINIVKEEMIAEQYIALKTNNSALDVIHGVDSDTPKATTASLAQWYSDCFVIGLPQELPQDPDSLKKTLETHGIEVPARPKPIRDETKVSNVYGTLALMTDYISRQKPKYRKGKDGNNINKSELANDLAAHNETHYEISQQSSESIRKTIRDVLLEAGIEK